MKDRKLPTEHTSLYGSTIVQSKRNLDGTVRNSKKMTREELQQKLVRESEEDSGMCTGIFRNLEKRGQSVDFCIKLHDWEPVNYTLYDGQMYRLPIGVAKHINNKCFKVQYVPLAKSEAALGVDADVTEGFKSGIVSRHNKLKAKRKVFRFSFDSTDFSTNSISRRSDIIEVTY